MEMDVDMGMEIEMEMELHMTGTGEERVCRYRHNCIQRWDREFHWAAGSCSRVERGGSEAERGREEEKEIQTGRERSRDRQKEEIL